MSQSVTTHRKEEAPPPLSEYLRSLYGPSSLLVRGYFFLVQSLISCLLHLRLAQFFSPSYHQNIIFSKLYDIIRPFQAQFPDDIYKLLLEIDGVVLDVGPGTGELTQLYDFTKIQAMYGAEPAPHMHAGLREQANKAGGGGKYEVLTCGANPESLIPELSRRGMLKAGAGAAGVFDSIVCIRALCSISETQATIDGLYGLLKPGGRIFFVEHVKQTWPHGGSMGGWIFQKLFMLGGWQYFLGNCRVDKDTEAMIRKAGKWSNVNAWRVNDYAALPYLAGVATKA